MDAQLNVTDDLALKRLEKSIRKKANDPQLIAFSRQALERAIERGITIADAARVLLQGDFCQPVSRHEERDEYRIKFMFASNGKIMAGVGVVQMYGDGGIFVITAEFIK